MLGMQAVNVLLMAGANVLLKCDTGADVLQCAAESGCHEVFERILEVQAFPTDEDPHCWCTNSSYCLLLNPRFCF